MSTAIMDKKLKIQLENAVEQAKEGDLDNAIPTLKSILEDNPDHDISLGMLASIYLQIGMHDQAIDLYNRLLKINPENPLARFQLGMAKLNSDKPEEALTAWEPMLGMENEFMANFHSALALMLLGRSKEALECILNAARHMPSSHPLYPKLLELHNQLTESTT